MKNCIIIFAYIILSIINISAMESNPLIEAIKSQNQEEIKKLSKQSKWLNKTSVDKETPLHEAARQNNFEAIKILIKAGAVVNITNMNSEKPIDLTNNQEIKDFLQEAEDEAEIQSFWNIISPFVIVALTVWFASRD
jgi:ankyrin repeat protein